MTNFKLIIEYDGTHYSGWQIQTSHKSYPDEHRQVTSHKREGGEDLEGQAYGAGRKQIKTIQGALEKKLSKILNEKIKISGSGRTDAGVHALGQVANFKTTSIIKPPIIKKALNSLLDKDIRIKSVSKVDMDFHARFSAKKKTYRYQISLTEPGVFERYYYNYIPYKLNLPLMKKEAKDLLGKHDFKCFEASGRRAKDTVRTISKASFTKKGNKLYFTIEGNGFLYNMVRNIVGTLIEIGRGKFPKGTIKELIKTKDRNKAGPTAKACGLVLVGVKY